MIGNDLVFLPGWGTHSSGRKERFRSKLFTPSEKDIVAKSGRSETEALLWSMKEAAYKIHYRSSPIAFYAPRQFRCEVQYFLNKQAEGLVRFGSDTFVTRSHITGEYLHTLALPLAQAEKFPSVRTEIRTYSKGDERLIRDERYVDKLHVRKNPEGVPQLYQGKDLTQHVISVSHDGEQIAYAWV